MPWRYDRADLVQRIHAERTRVLTPSHIPYLAGADCSSCHSSSTYAVGTFGPSNMTQARHAFVSTNCVTCHEKGFQVLHGSGEPALQGRPADHTAGQMVAPNNCSICHTTANWNSTALPAGHMPNPGNQACTVCHTAAPATTPRLAANAVLHTGISSGCITCHGAPSATPPVFYNNFTPKSAKLSPVHIPTGATPCEDCHSKTAFTTFSATSMSSSKHALMFAFIGSTCNACHNRVTPALSFYGVTNLTIRPTGDPHNKGNALNNDCSGCHSPNNWGGNTARRTVKATTTRSSVTTVVNAAAASRGAAGAGARRIGGPSDGRPGARGGVGGVAAMAGAARPSHIGVTSNCAGCHNGVLATGKGAGHIASNGSCENCHTVFSWTPARFDHRGVTASCAGCHNGVAAAGKPARHVQTNQDCSTCHGTITWTAAKFSHLGINATCQSCHNGITATAKQVQHPPTTLDCGTCHSTLNWHVTSPAPRLRPLIPGPRNPGARPADGSADGPPARPPPRPPAGPAK
jgi:hypothetical protein